jgi:hypothetical protein
VLFFIAAIGQLAFFTDIHQFPNPKFNNKRNVLSETINSSPPACIWKLCGARDEPMSRALSQKQEDYK